MRKFCLFVYMYECAIFMYVFFTDLYVCEAIYLYNYLSILYCILYRTFLSLFITA